MCKVSIIIPAYNVSAYIERCIQSALNQSLIDIQIIVVNDGSTDNTVLLVEKFIDERIIVVDKKNGGLSSARRAGLKKVKGEYIYQLDGDDWLEKDALLDMYTIATQNKYDVVIADAFVDDDDEGNLSILQGATTITGDYLQDFLTGRITPNFWTKLYHRDLYFKNEIAYNDNISIGEDTLVNIQLIFYAKNIGRIHKSYLHYIQRNSSLSKVYSEKMYQVYDMIADVKKFLNIKNVFEKYSKEFELLEYVHTYYYRVLVDVAETKIHKDFYHRGQQKYQQYLNNPFIINFLETRQTGLIKIERLFRINYYLGRYRLKLASFAEYIRNK
jgi:glycosyltransferase involved in cell wall biosynthesis